MLNQDLLHDDLSPQRSLSRWLFKLQARSVGSPHLIRQDAQVMLGLSISCSLALFGASHQGVRRSMIDPHRFSDDNTAQSKYRVSSLG
jgi:hypothetical protein